MGAAHGTLEDVIAAAVRAEVAAQVDRVVDAVERLRKSLPPRFVGVAEAAEAMGVSRATVRRMVASGELPHRRAGSRVLIDMSALHAGE